VKPGWYPETVSISIGGNLTDRVIFRSEGNVTLRRFNIRNSSIIIEGFRFANITGQYVGYIDTRDVSNLTDLHMRNNIMVRGVHLISDNITIIKLNLTQGVINSSDANFLSNGFITGSNGVITCHELSNISNTNSSNAIVIDNSSETQVLFHLIYYDNLSFADNIGGIPLHCIMYVNSYGFLITAENYTIINNTLDDLWGNFINIFGSNSLVENNTMTNINGWDVFRIFGENHVVRNNFAKDGRLAWGIGNHPDMFQTWTNDNTTKSQNILIEDNFFLNLESQICMQENSQNSSYMKNWTVRHNVFAMPMNESYTLAIQANIADYSPQEWYKNTFFRIGGTGGEGVVLSSGSKGLDVAKDNAFVGCAGNIGQGGWYGGSADYADYNYVSKQPPMFDPKNSVCAEPNVSDGYNFCELHGINGGDPLLQNVEDILGPDGKPWTDDDGLMPLANSVLCHGASDGGPIGAYECKGCTSSEPIAFFSINALTGYTPLNIIVNASDSLSCAASLDYSWDFDDGSTDIGVNQSNIYLEPGTYIVRLNVTNNLGYNATYSRMITVYPAAEAGLVVWLNLDNTTTDLSGRYHQFNWIGNSSYDEGLKNQGFSAHFNNSAPGYINSPHADDLDGYSEVTYSFWAKKHNASEQEIVLNKHTVLLIQINSNGFTYYLVNETTTPSQRTRTAINNDTNWHYYVLRYDGSSIDFFFDGSYSGSENTSGPINSDPSRPLVIGKDPWGQTFNGDLDEIKIYERALNTTEIQETYNEGIDVSACHEADFNNNGVISDSEMQSYSNRWIVSTADVSLNQLMFAMTEWKGGCS